MFNDVWYFPLALSFPLVLSEHVVFANSVNDPRESTSNNKKCSLMELFFVFVFLASHQLGRFKPNNLLKHMSNSISKLGKHSRMSFGTAVFGAPRRRYDTQPEGARKFRRFFFFGRRLTKYLTVQSLKFYECIFRNYKAIVLSKSSFILLPSLVSCKFYPAVSAHTRNDNPETFGVCHNYVVSTGFKPKFAWIASACVA